MRSRPLLVALLLLDLGGLVVLHDLGAQPWARLDAGAAPEDAVMAVLRLAAVVAGWWLAGSTTLYALARVRRAGSLAAGLRRFTLPAARRLVEASLVATLTVAPAPAAFAEEARPPVVAVEDPPAALGEVLPPVVAPPRHATRRKLPTPGDDLPSCAPRDACAPEPAPSAHEHVVRSGEHLWSIAARRLGVANPDAVARYWRRLVATNRDRLRSGHPDLIYPGEVVLLPPLDDR